jgi:hypothetical protein
MSDEQAPTVAEKRRKSSLSTLDWYRLNQACRVLWFIGGSTYLVGTAANGGDYRDVDVRTILQDEEFDRLFSGHPDLWALVCSSIAMRLVAATGLPIDYQIQRMTEANETYPGGNRHPVGLTPNNFAGGGDATRFEPDESNDGHA